MSGPISHGTLSVLTGGSVTLWAAPGAVDTEMEFQLRLEPHRPAVVGRAEGSEVPYLNPAYRPTTMVPGTRQTILREQGRGNDVAVSRGHFMLKASVDGIVFVNGVPSRAGGIRPPLNGTLLISPQRRKLSPCEEYLIASGTMIVIELPNNAQIQIGAATEKGGE